MIYFVTNNTDYYKTSISPEIFKDIIILNEEEGKKLYFTKLGKRKVVAFDMEATGLDPYLTTPLLWGFGTDKFQFAFDWTCNLTDIIIHAKKYNKTILGQNLKYDIKLTYVNTGVMLTNLYDTMIAEQRLYMKSGYDWGLDELIKRYCNKIVSKSTRNDFINADIKTFKINSTHLYYLKGDLIDLFTIRKKQQEKIHKFNMEFLIYGIEFPFISIIAEAELDGFELNIERWRARLNKEKAEKFELELRLDEIFREIRDFKSLHKLYEGLDPKILLGGNKYNNPRKHNPMYDIFKSDGTTTEINLFGDFASHRDITRVKKKVVSNPNNVSYSSKTDIVRIFAGLGEPLPTIVDTTEVPKILPNGKIKGGVNYFTIKEEHLEKFILLRPDNIMREFIEGILKHSKLSKAISTYGENFINKIHPTTGKIHTIFRQCFADTGRMQSGGGKKEPDKINYQNIPAEKEYRNAFTVDTTKYSLASKDYSGAELVVMASHAQDFRLIEISQQDMHSYMATKCYRNIYAFRARNIIKLVTKVAGSATVALKEQYTELVKLAQEYTVTKALVDIRTAFKPMTFGTIYGMYAKKAGTTLNIPKEEGQIVIDTIKQEIPATFRMVEKASFDAKRQGYIIINERTNSRAWFPNLIKLLRGQINEKDNFMDISEEMSAARNIRIQGTQADFVKEASVVIKKFIVKNKLDIRILSWVHDELVIKVALYLDGKSKEWEENKHNISLRSPITGKIYDNANDAITELMEEVANRYLVNIKIKVDSHVEPYWTK